MGFLKNLSDKAKSHVENIKNNVSRQDLLDLVSECQKDIADGGVNNDTAKYKAGARLLSGLGKMAVGKYEGASRKLENIHKDPHDIEMAAETRDALDETMLESFNARKFVFGSQEDIDDAAAYIISNMYLIKDDTYLPRMIEYMDNSGLKYDKEAMEKEIKAFKNKDDIKLLLATKDQVDKYIFIDRMTKEEILRIPGAYTAGLKTVYHYQCEYCRRKFVKPPRTGLNQQLCEFHPAGNYKGPHKYHTLGADKLWID